MYLFRCGLETSAFVDDSCWHHYIVSIQLPTETVKVYHNDQLLETNTDCKLLDTLEFNENDTFSVTFGSVQKRGMLNRRKQSILYILLFSFFNIQIHVCTNLCISSVSGV